MKRSLTHVLLGLMMLTLCLALCACGSAPVNDTPSANEAPSILPTVPVSDPTGNDAVQLECFPAFTVHSISVPAQIRTGSTLELSGSVTISRGSISQVTVTLYNADNTEAASGMLCPGGTSYTFDSSFTDITGFRNLPAGNYRLTVTVSAQDDIYANDEIVLNTSVTLY